MMKMETYGGQCACGKTFENIKSGKQYYKMKELHYKKCEICKNAEGKSITTTSIERIRVRNNNMKTTSMTTMEETEEKTIN